MPAEAHAHAGLWPWEAVKPHDVAELLRGMDAPWWLTGGWGVRRRAADVGPGGL